MLRRRKIVRHGIELLEDRKMLAGNILVNIGSTTTIAGDDVENGLEISKGTGADEVIFRGLDGTTINGNAAPFVQTIQGGLGSLKIDLKGGGDLLVITNFSEATATWPVAAAPQTGTDLDLSGDLTIADKSGNNVVLLRHLNVTGKLNVKTGANDDIIVAESLTVGGAVALNTGSGSDQVLIRGLNVAGKTTISTGSGDDAVGVYSAVAQQLSQIKLGGDNDQAWIETNTLNGVKFVGGSGTNELTEDFAAHNTITGGVKTSKIEQHLELTSAVHFGYEADIGPDHWGALTPSYLLSEAGRQQSPVNIITANVVDTTLPTIAISYLENADVDFVHNGHTVQVNLPAGNSITVDGDTYQLLQFHFHTVSEHEVDGVDFPLEFHLVHRDSAGNLLVLGVFVEEGAANPAFDDLIANLPNNTGTPTTTIPGPLNPETLLPVDRDYYAYNGSLTTPPASEGVSFAIFKTPIQMSPAQIAAITTAIGGPNARPVQPVNDRVIFG